MTTHFRELRAHLVPVRFMELKRFLMLSFRHVAQRTFEDIYIYIFLVENVYLILWGTRFQNTDSHIGYVILIDI